MCPPGFTNNLICERVGVNLRGLMLVLPSTAVNPRFQTWGYNGDYVQRKRSVFTYISVFIVCILRRRQKNLYKRRCVSAANAKYMPE